MIYFLLSTIVALLVYVHICKHIDQMEERLRQQIDSYGATVGDLVDYVERQEKG